MYPSNWSIRSKEISYLRLCTTLKESHYIEQSGIHGSGPKPDNPVLQWPRHLLRVPNSLLCLPEPPLLVANDNTHCVEARYLTEVSLFNLKQRAGGGCHCRCIPLSPPAVCPIQDIPSNVHENMVVPSPLTMYKHILFIPKYIQSAPILAAYMLTEKNKSCESVLEWFKYENSPVLDSK